MTNILICGISGKMGGNVLSLLENDPEAKAVCGVDFYPKQLSVPVYKTFSEVKEPVDVIIDFSSPEALEDRLKFAEEKARASSSRVRDSARKNFRSSMNIPLAWQFSKRQISRSESI